MIDVEVPIAAPKRLRTTNTANEIRIILITFFLETFFEDLEEDFFRAHIKNTPQIFVSFIIE